MLPAPLTNIFEELDTDITFVLCIENEIYKKYLKNTLNGTGRSKVLFIDKNLIANSVSENSNVILILQSDTDEFVLVEIATKLKRLFSNEIKIIFLSSDYQLGDEVSVIVDRFLQFPLSSTDLVTQSLEIISPSRKVLLIDDSKLVHKTIVDDLKEAGFEVYQAFDGQEGYERAVEVRPAVVICDIEMPRMNGYQTCEAIRKDQNLRDIHIIMSSTLGSATDQKKGFQAGVDEYITKPVIIEELIERVGKVFSGSGAGRESLLILDKNTSLSNEMSKSLIQQGFSVRSSETIKAMTKSLNRISCDLVIAEIEPNGGTIIDLFHEINILDQSSRPDVLVVVPENERSDTRMVLNAGASAVLAKPFTNDSLLAIVERSLGDRRSRKEKEQLGRYVSKASMRMAVEKAILGSDDNNARADKKLASVFFSDIAGFTDRCERYSAKEIVEQINLLFKVMTEVIIRNEGDIDKFIGDACMAFWLDEIAASSSEKILKSILEMQHQIDLMNSEHPLLSKDPIVVRMGANSGEVILCDIGAADARMDLTIIGDTVNVAARLESASKQYGLTNLVSENVVQGNEGKFLFRMIDKVRVKGKKEPLNCYELMCLKGSEKNNHLNLKQEFELALSNYNTGNFETALLGFNKSTAFEEGKELGVTPSSIYISRCEYLLENPPGNWDGIWTLTEK